MTLFVAGLSYKTAPVEVREQIAVPPAKLRCFGCRLKISGDLSEVVLLSTCNRVEIYGIAPRVDGRINRLFQSLTTGATDFRPHLYVKEGDEAVRHLFSVASGLDSMVLGETEITGQVKHAYQTAKEAGLTGGHLNRVFQTALQTAKRIRTGTQIGRGATSVGSVAVELAEKIFGPRLTGQTIMIIAPKWVRPASPSGQRSAIVLVSNRSIERAQELAQEFGGRAMRFDQFLEAMVETDIVVSSTGCPQTILRRPDLESVMRARRQRPLFLIDIAVPRDIDPEAQFLENVYLYNIDHLEALVRENVRHREQELALCRAIVDEQTAVVMAKLNLIKEKAYDLCLQPQPGWVFCGAVACGG